MNRPTISVREKCVALFGALTLAYTAWGFGGIIAWSLHIMLAGGLLTLALAVGPWPVRRRQRPGARSQKGLLQLFRLPAFWFASAFLLYLAIGALNPAWQIASDPRGWWIEPMTPPLAAWLPSSVAGPYEPMNAWRIFNLHLAAFALALGLSIGLTRRSAVLFVLWVFVLNASAMAVVAMIQKYTGAEAVLGVFKSENRHFWGSFFYRNQAVAYLNWGLVIAGVLYFYHARRSRDEGRSGGPHFMAFCLIGLLAVSVGLALSRGGILFAGVLTAIFLSLVLLDYCISAFHFRPPAILAVSLIVALMVGAGSYQVYKGIDWLAVEERFGDIAATIENADRDARALSSKQTWKMAQDALLTGWGAGSFRYVFPIYQKEIPELFYVRYHKKRGWEGRRFYRYAHNDILQFLAEYGMIGCSLLLLAIISLLLPALKAILHAPCAILYLLVGLLAAASHAFLEFIFHSPAYWVVLLGGLALASRLMVLQHQAERLR
ncbi:MAG: O-antigen ligase family protein [Opitutales bacterium]